ncbi:hypothetical protein RhiirA1_479275 [Rhizophagus irregularis]|uniref:Uncharacterized protein n=1 Tax=Rhizophagus irregularis TaxID=588596 RepID=A0A2N0QQX3_9GLOM|nr:hypothetical protein RhiirA1_479275 [Rhizophagus irregularis]
MAFFFHKVRKRKKFMRACKKRISFIFKKRGNKNTWKILSPVYKWSENAVKTLKPEKSYLSEIENFQRLIQMLLFKLIIDNEANLHTLEFEIHCGTRNSYFNNILEKKNRVY